jgi:hypothetical protein
MDNEEVAVVVRRSTQSNQPYVAIFGRPNGEMLPQPRLHGTAKQSPHIRSALTASAVRTRLNHFHILQLGAYAAQQP